MTEEAATDRIGEAGRSVGAPLVTADGPRLFARRPGRELFPASWLRHRVRIAHDGGSGSPKGVDLSGESLE